MTERPYHKYVFDSEKRKFVGDFEEMYKNEAVRNYDSWSQDDLTDVVTRLSLTILGVHSFESVLDVGCGKGAFTHLLKKKNNRVVGIDISQTAINKAKVRYPNVEFRCLDIANGFGEIKEHFELVIVKEVLSYIKN